MATILTAATVEKLKPASSRREIADSRAAGLYLVVQPSGAKSWAFRFRSPIERDAKGQRIAKKLTLGPLANSGAEGEPKIGLPLTLTQARALATAAAERVARGEDPTRTRREEKAREKAAAVNLDKIDDAFVEFLERYRGKKRQGLRESTRLLTATYLGYRRDGERWVKTGGGVIKRWSGRALADLTRKDVNAAVDAIADAGHGVTANRTLTVLKTFFGWAVRRDMIQSSPAAMVDAPAAERSRERVLTDTEIIAVWKAAEAEAYPFGCLVQLLLLTGARRDELREATWREFDLGKGVWTLPAARAKNGREHVIPLPRSASEILKGLPRIKGELLFTTTGDTPVSGLSRAKDRIHTAASKVLGADLAPWTLHDLRRTCGTAVQRMFGVEVMEAVLNHKSGMLRGVAGVYGRDDYFEQKKAALAAWAEHIAKLTASD